LKTTTGGYVVPAVAGTDYANFAYPFTSGTNFGATVYGTSSLLWFQNGIQASSTSQFGTTNFWSNVTITTPAGTADVMELLAKVTFTPKEIEDIVNDIGGCIVWGGKLGIAPADDIIIRVEEPLSFESFDKVIVSIMAKKVAAGTNHLILDLGSWPHILDLLFIPGLHLSVSYWAR
jgi:hypothetical protein